MTISFRTPEGVPGRCPVCEAVVCIEPSATTGDAPCPQCGQLLWFVQTASSVRFYPRSEVSPRKQRLIEQVLARQAAGDLDSLDVVELIMELEDEFKFTIPDDLAMKIESLHNRRLG